MKHKEYHSAWGLLRQLTSPLPFLEVDMKRLLLVLILCAPAWAANVFTTDANCVALWRLESGALATDSIGTNDTLYNSVTADGTVYKEGSYSGTFSYSISDMTIQDSNLSSNFPLKSGDANKKISVCFWLYYTSSTNRWLFGKGDDGSSYSFTIHNITGTGIDMWIGYNGGSSYEILTGPDYGADLFSKWYHVGATFDDSTKAWHMRVWNDTVSEVNDVSGTTTNNIYVGNEGVGLGCDGTGDRAFSGRLDEVVVFNDILTSDEIDAIRNGTYPAPVSTGTSD